jgi:hypothetical protein
MRFLNFRERKPILFDAIIAWNAERVCLTVLLMQLPLCQVSVAPPG